MMNWKAVDLDGKLTLEMTKNNMLNEEVRKKRKIVRFVSSSSNAYVVEFHGKTENNGCSQTRFQQGKKSRGDQR